MAPQIVYFYLLIFVSCVAGSEKHCDSLLYNTPLTTFLRTNRTCKTEHDVTHSIVNGDFGEISIDLAVNLTHGDYVFEFHLSSDDCRSKSLHTRLMFVLCHRKCNTTLMSCSNKINFNVSYVFNGSYCAMIKSRQNEEIWKSRSFNVTTNYMKARIDEAVLSAACIPKSVRKQLEVTIEGNRSMFSKNPALDIYLAPNHSNETFSFLWEKPFCHPNYSHECHVKNNQEICVFNVEPGKYKLIVLLGDSRCNSDTLWTDYPGLCIFGKDCELTPAAVGNSTQKMIIGSILLTVIFLCISFLLIKRIRIRMRPQNQLVNHNMNENEGNEYLIIYARETDKFEAVVDKLKQILSQENQAKVTTLYELDRKCQNPRKWLEEKLTDENIRIILFLNYASAFALHRKYKQPHCFDFLFTYSLQFLRSDLRRSYHNLYVVQVMDKDLRDFQFLNALARYKLLQHASFFLHNLGISTNENAALDLRQICNEYNDSCDMERYLQDVFV